jgi:hypothetical protein
MRYEEGIRKLKIYIVRLYDSDWSAQTNMNKKGHKYWRND